jgi:hypothetical protein
MMIPSLIGNSSDLVFCDIPNVLGNGLIGLKSMLTDPPKNVTLLAVVESFKMTGTGKRFTGIAVFIPFNSFLCSSLGNTSDLFNLTVGVIELM